MNAPTDAGRKFNRWLAVLVFASLVWCAVWIAVRVGIDATPYETTDSAGRTMGFNDRLSHEHFVIILRHFRVGDLLAPERAYEWLLLAMHGVGAWMLLSRTDVSVRLTRWFFVLQAALFPLGLLLCWLPPLVLFDALRGGMDRENLTDFPFVGTMGMLAHSAWVIASLAIAFALRGPGLGLARVWRALRETMSAGSRAFVETVRAERSGSGAYAASKTWRRYSMLLVAMVSAPSSNLNTSTETMPS